MNQIVDEYINSINEIPTFKAALLEKEQSKKNIMYKLSALDFIGCEYNRLI